MARLYCMMVAVLLVVLQVYMATAGYHGGVIYKKLHYVGHDSSYGHDDSYERYGYTGGHKGYHGGHHW